MRFGSVCSGIEAASVAWHPLGWRAAWLSEIEPFPSAVLEHHYPEVPNLGDMTMLPERILSGEIEAPDILCGGTPCQAFSVAGLRKSLDDARGNLSLTFCEIANAIDSVRTIRGDHPAIIFWENVPGVLNTKDNAFGCFLAGLAGEDGELKPSGKKWTNAGCVFGPKRAVAWRVLDAQYFGLAQRRRRVFVVASARDGFDPAEILFEFDGVRRDSAPSRETGEAIARSAAFSAGNSSNARSVGYVEEGTPPLRAGASGTNQVPTCITVSRMVAFGEYVDDGTASTMKARDYKDATDLVVYPVYGLQGNMIGRADTAGPQGCGYGEELSFTLTKTDVHAVEQPILFQEVADCLTAPCGTKRNGNASADNGSLFAAQSMAVRRLTPTECERLQGFPDGYTEIPWRNKAANDCPDGPRYKALGNSWAVPVVAWIGKRIDLAIELRNSQ